MKKIINYMLLIIMIFGISFTVNAQEYQKNTLIPVDTIATVRTDKFDYQDFTYNSAVDARGNTLISFGSIQNNTLSKTEVSINMLLFNAEQKNIGFLTYCSVKDVSSNYSGFKLGGGQASAFSISVTSKYLIGANAPGDVKFVAVLDENTYCQVGGYDKYKGLTIEQIANNGKPVEEEKKTNNFDILEFFQNSEIMPYVLGIIIGFVSLIVLGSILNTLHKKMYAKSTVLAYIPGFNSYVAVKMAFGNIVAIIFVILLIVSGILFYINIPYLVFVSSGIIGLAFLIDLIKIATKKYNLLYFEPAIKTATYQVDNSSSKKDKVTEVKPVENNSVAQQIIDLSYDNVDDEDDDLQVGIASNDTSNVSSDDRKSIDNSNSNNSSVDVDDLYNSINDDDDDGESDLSGFE